MKHIPAFPGGARSGNATCGIQSSTAPPSIRGAMSRSTSVPKAGGGRGACRLPAAWRASGWASGRRAAGHRPCAPITPTLSISCGDRAGEGSREAWWSLLPGGLEGAGVIPGAGWAFLKGLQRLFRTALTQKNLPPPGICSRGTCQFSSIRPVPVQCPTLSRSCVAHS